MGLEVCASACLGHGTVHQPRGIRFWRKSVFLKEDQPVWGVFFFHLSFFAAGGCAEGGGGAVAFTRRNDASQPRLHPAPPQRDRLFGKNRVGVKGGNVSVGSLRITLCPCNTSSLRHAGREGVRSPSAPKTSKLTIISRVKNGG